MSARDGWDQELAVTPRELAEPFLALGPADCDAALRGWGFEGSGARLLQAAENRVFRSSDLVLKVYRPCRWSPAAIQDELDFLAELHAEGLAVPRPLGGVRQLAGAPAVVFEALGGGDEQAPERATAAQVDAWVALIAAMHRVGRRREAEHRPRFDPVGHVGCILRSVARFGLLPEALRAAHEAQARRIAEALSREAAGLPFQRIHGDPGPNNLIWTGAGPALIDFDDLFNGPVAADLFLLGHSSLVHEEVPGDLDGRTRWARQTAGLTRRYRAIQPLSDQEEGLFELLFALRSLRFDAWFCARWSEPSFRAAYDEDDPTGRSFWEEGLESRARNLQEAAAG